MKNQPFHDVKEAADIIQGEEYEHKRFQEKNRTFIAAGTVLLIVAAVAMVWKNLKKIYETLEEEA